MKRFYTFAPKNFRIFAKMKSFIAVALMFVMAMGNVNAQIYQLVTDASQLAVGDRIIIAASGFDYAIGTNQKSNNREAVAITKTGNVAEWTTSVQVLVLEEGSVTNTFAFNTGVGYLYAASGSSNYLKTQSTKDANGSWLITVNGEGVANIVAQGTNSHNVMQYNNSSASNLLFSCYASASQKSLCIYKYTVVCPEIENLQVANVASRTATITWTSSNTAFDYKLNGEDAVFTPVQDGNDWTLTFTELNPETTYSFQVKPTCATSYSTLPVVTTPVVYHVANLDDIHECAAFDYTKMDGTIITCTETSIIYDTLVAGAADGEDTVNIVNVTVGAPSPDTYIYVTKCQSELAHPNELEWGGVTFDDHSTARVYPVAFPKHFTNAQGCDSTVYMYLTIKESFNTSETRTICENKLPYNWDDNADFTAAGTQEVNLTAANGCDSVVTMTLVVNTNTTASFDVVKLENGLPFVTLGGQEYETSGVYYDTIDNANGCDSIITWNLTVYNNVYSTLDSTICANAIPFAWNNVVFTEAGTQNDTLRGAGVHGVDSIITMNVVVNPTFTDTIYITKLDVEMPLDTNGIHFEGTATESVTLTASNNCDSTVVMVVTVIPTYQVNATVEHGTVTPASILVPENTIVTYTITSDECYELDQITVNGVDFTDSVSGNTFETDPITAATDVVVTFKQIMYALTVSHTGEGTVDAPATIGCGDTVAIVMNAEEGWHIANYTIGAGTTYNTEAEPNDWNIDTIMLNSVAAATDVNVVFERNTYTVSVCNPGNGNTLSVDNAEVYYDSTAVVTVTAGEGYHITSINGIPCADTSNNNTIATYNVENIKNDTTICAAFTLNAYPITVINNGNGVVDPTTQNWNWGGNASFDIIANDCYQISRIAIDDVDLPAGYRTDTFQYTFENVVSAHTLEVEFEQMSFNMTYTLIPEGSATVNDGTVTCGEDFTYNIEAGVGQHLVYVVDNGVFDTIFDNQQDVYSLTRTNIHEDHVVTVFTDIDHYQITANVEGNGVISANVADINDVIYNTPVTFTMTPSACQELVSFTIDGEEHINDVVANAYVWTATNDVEVVATFDTIVYPMTETHTGEGTVTTGSVNCGEDFTYTINAAEGWHIASYTVGAGTTYNTEVEQNDWIEATPNVANVTDTTNIDVVFERNTYTVTVCDPGNGNVLSADPTEVYYDSTAVVTVTAATGYHITSINGIPTSGANTEVTFTYNVQNIQRDTNICAEFELHNYTITASVADDVNGQIEPAGEIAAQYGDTVSFTVKPTNDCHYISTIVVDGNGTTYVNDSAAYTYTFYNVTDDHTIVANFETYRYEVATSVNDETMGTITATDTLNCGETFDYTVTPEVGYHIVSVLEDGVAQTIADSNTFSNSFSDLHANHTVVATFGINHYEIVVTTGANGTITPGDTVLEHGESITYTITPNDCYYISEVIVDGTPINEVIETGMSYEFAAITGAHTLEANFEIYQYAMQETHTGNGTVTTATVNCGDEYTYTITADQGWHIANYSIGNATFYNTMTEPNDYNSETFTIAAARQDTTLNVTFEIDTYTVTACTAVGGTLTVNEPVEVDSNSNTTVTVVADALNGYHIVSITDSRGGVLNLGNNTDIIRIYNVNNVDQDIEVCATFALNTFNIHAEAGENGTIIPEGDTTITFGETITYTIEPNHTCYYISGINVDGTTVWTGYTDSISATTYTFTASDFAAAMVDHTISTEYTIFKYNMASTSTNLSYPVNGGTVTSDPARDCGLDYDYVITAATGYHIDHIVLDGVTTNYTGQQASDVITVSDIHEDHQLDAFFAINHYDIVATCTENGTITPAGTTDVEHFSTLTYTINADQPCYHVEDVLIDGVSVGDIVPNTTDLATYTYSFENIDGPHTIHAIFTIDRYAMAETHVGNGTVTTDTVNCGDAYQYTITADSGWHINNHTLGATTYTLNHNNDVVAYRNVTAATQDTTLDVVFARNLYTVTVTSTGNGTTTPGTTTYEFEDDAIFNMTPATGYNVLDVLVDGVSVGAVTSYTFNSIAANHTLDVVYSADVYVVNASAEANGTITVAGDNQVEFGQSVNFTVVADPCYHISAIVLDGVADNSFDGQTVATYTINNVDAPHTVVAQFAINTYDVTVNVVGNGTVTPTTNTYNCGDDVNFTITPDAGNSVASVVVNGMNVGAVDTYTINNIGADYVIDVTFTANEYTLNAVAYNNGTITPAGETVVAEGANFTYTLTPDACQTVSEILVNGVSYLDNENFDGSSLTLNDIHSDMLIQAYYQVMTYNVEATQVDGGVITETGVFDCGTDVVYTITPNACYSIADVLVDGASVGAVETFTFNAINANHTITATFEMNTYTVTATAGQGGTITATETFDCGETPTYTITPDAGYYIVNVDVDSVSFGAIDTYTFGALNADHTIEATFAKYTYTVVANANTGVEIAPAAGETVVEYGDNLTYNFTVDACYDIVDVTVDGESVGAVTTYTLSDIQADHVINVVAEVKTYTITATVTGEGTITPAGETTVTCGASQFYTITPAVGYVIDDVTVDGASVGVVTDYNFENVTADHTIAVVFTAIADSTYTITATATGNGTIAPAGATTVNYGASQTYTMVADEFYTIGDVLVDGESVGAVPTYTFANVTEDHTIEVIFTEAECEVPTYAWTDPISNTTATLNWTDMGATSYTVRYKLASDSIYTVVANITDNFYELTGLTENTEYVWNVKSVCVAGVAESNWTAQQSFRTEGADDTSHIGIQDIDLAVINVYSNGNDIYVVNNSNEQINNVQVFDINGRMVYNGAAQSNPTVINVNAANGIYVVRVTTTTMVRNYKVSISQR